MMTEVVFGLASSRLPSPLPSPSSSSSSSLLLSTLNNYSSMNLHPALTSSSSDDSSTTTMNDKIERPLLSIVIVVHLFIIALGLLGNSLIIYLVVVNIRLRNARNAFMLNLTFSNILLVTICTPSFLVSISTRSWSMGAFWCKFLHSVQIVVVLVSAFSIAMIAIDRWIFVVYAQTFQLKSAHVCLIVVGIWSLAIALSVPTFVLRHTDQLYGDSFYNRIKELPASIVQMMAVDRYDNPVYCIENWPVPAYKRIYILVLFVLEFVLPCLTMLITYIWIIRFLKKHDDKMNHYELLHKRLVQKERHHQKNCKVLSVLCITFIVCCLPLSFFNIKSEFEMTSGDVGAAGGGGETVEEVSGGSSGDSSGGGDAEGQKGMYSSLTLLTTLEEMNAILSPLLYGWMNHNFRNAINEKLGALKTSIKKKKSRKSIEAVAVPVAAATPPTLGLQAKAVPGLVTLNLINKNNNNNNNKQKLLN